MDAIRPAAGHQIGPAGLFMRKSGLKLRFGHLMDGFGFTAHCVSPSDYERNIACPIQ
jgi:hypothetical protein